MSDLVERLYNVHQNFDPEIVEPLATEAADRITALEAQLAEARKPLGDEALVELMSREFCLAENRDPDKMTYITDDGVMQPYGPAWQWSANGMQRVLAAISPHIRALCAAEYRRGLEDAADVADQQSEISIESGDDDVWQDCANQIAAEIRALIPKDQAGE